MHGPHGEVRAWRAAYPDPVRKGKHVARQFGPEYELEARKWLEEEHFAVVMHRKGVAEWRHPTEREREERVSRLTLGQFVDEEFLPAQEKRLKGNSMRNLRAKVSHWLPELGGLILRDIGPRDIAAWLNREHDEGAHAFYDSACTLKRVLESATKVGPDGREPIRPDNPFVFPLSEPGLSKRNDIPPVTPDEVRRLVEAMPEYDRIAIWLGLLVGGLRVGEVCGIQVGDFDFERMQLFIRHSVDRGPDDRGRARLCEPKTSRSKRMLPVPALLVPLIREHVARFCDPGPEAMLLKARIGEVMSPVTLHDHFRVARKAAGREDITFHHLRASHATLFMLHGGTLREVMDELGHKSEKVAIRHYQRVVPGHRRHVAEMMAFDFLPDWADEGVLRSVIGELEDQIAKLESTVRELRGRLGDV